MAEYKVYDIVYDTDGEEISFSLPDPLFVEIDATGKEEIEEALSDAISNITGYCHNGFLYEPLTTEKNTA